VDLRAAVPVPRGADGPQVGGRDDLLECGIGQRCLTGPTLSQEACGASGGGETEEEGAGRKGYACNKDDNVGVVRPPPPQRKRDLGDHLNPRVCRHQAQLWTRDLFPTPAEVCPRSHLLLPGSELRARMERGLT